MNTTYQQIDSVKRSTRPGTFDESWWAHFLKITNNFTKTSVLKEAFTQSDSTILESQLLVALENICKRKTTDFGFRFFIDNKRLTDKELDSLVFSSPPLPGEDISAWLSRIGGDSPTGVIINSCEKFSEPLARGLSGHLLPLLKEYGIPLNGLHTTTFIGNYGFTPLGIHQDHIGANVIHFHLGPGEKTMYTWEENEFKLRLNGRSKKDVPLEELIPFSKTFTFGCGDVYFMPWNQFHIGEARDFSIGVTLWFENHIRTQVLNNLISIFQNEYIDQSDTTITHPESDVNNLLGYQDIRSILQLDPSKQSKSFKEILHTIYEENMYCLFSNWGFNTSPLTMAEEYEFNEDDYDFIRTKSVILVLPYKIFYKRSEDNSRLLIFARGQKIEINYSEEVCQLIDLLNAGNPVDVDIAVSRIFTSIPIEVGLYIFTLLYNKRAIALYS